MLIKQLVNKQLLFISVAYLFISGSILFLFNGTGNEADSINHYLYAKYAPVHPNLYFNHWAKPLFTLIASPFTQFGFLGIKVFNIICGLISSLLIYKISSGLKLQNPLLAPLFYFIFPLSFLTNFSGLTEPLFAVFLSFSIYFLLQKRFLLTAILISFTPFIRSEGLLFIILFASYFVYKGKFKSLMLLGTGHLIYAVIGTFFDNEFLWVFSKIPYANLESFYGNGTLFHFADKLIYITGVPLLVFFTLGLLRRFLPKFNLPKNEVLDLLVIGFVFFFLAHTIFWYLGVFNSMGLERVFAAVTPLMAIICLYGFNLLEFIQQKWIKKTLKFVSVSYIVLFIFSSSPASINWKKEMNLSRAQLNANMVADFISNSDLLVNRLVYTDPFLSEALQIDPFDINKRLILSKEAIPLLKSGDLVIWDNWHAVIDYAVNLNQLINQEGLIIIKEFKIESSKYIILKKE